MPLSQEEFLALSYVSECVSRGVVTVDGERITYNLNQKNHTIGVIRKNGFGAIPFPS
jgi:hypothetical protein